MTMTLIETIEVGAGGAASIEFTSIPQDGVDLVLKVSARTDRSAGADIVSIQFNGETATTNYSTVYLGGTGSGVSSLSSPDQFGSYTSDDANTSNTFSNSSIYISNYTSSAAKSFSSDSVSENNATAAYQGIAANLWNNTDAITSIKLGVVYGTNFKQYSTASLYKIS